MIKDKLHQINSKLPSDVTLVAVSKFHPVERLMEAYNAGQRVFAESRPQELAAKVPQMPADVQWHFIGHLQTNKLKLVLPYVSLVQSVDSLHLLQAISTWAVANNKVIASASLRPLPTRNASDDAAVGPSLLHGRGWPWVCKDTPAPLRNIRIRGLMGMASNTEDMEQVEGEFARIEALYKRIKASGMEGFDTLSIGMSGDWPLAVQHGATMVRIGTDIFGPREY